MSKRSWSTESSPNEADFNPDSNKIIDQMASEDDQDSGPRWPFQSIGSPDVILVPKGIFKDINTLLGQVGQATASSISVGAAEQLPALPGLTVSGVGVSLPLRSDQADLVLRHCEREAVGVWSQSPDHVQIQNPRWARGLQQLSHWSTQRLSFQGVQLHPVLSRILVVGPEGQVMRQQDDDESGRAVAKLIVQLPSEYTGGDLIVHHQDKQQDYRYTLSGVAYKPLFALFPADAFHAVEEVTGGYRLVLEYWFSLPPGQRLNNPQIVRLAETIKKLRGNDVANQILDAVYTGRVDTCEDSAAFALLLSTSCTKTDIEAHGVEALSGVDRDRFQVLRDANSRLKPEAQLRFFFVCLHYRNLDKYAICDETLPTTSASWYMLTGEKLCDGRYLAWTKGLQFLNPANETVGQLFTDGAFYERCAIVGWRSVVDVPNIYHFMREAAASTVALSEIQANTVNISSLNEFGVDYQASIKKGLVPHVPAAVTLTFCLKFCIAISESNDSSLAAVFVTQYFSCVERKVAIIPSLVAIIDKLGWSPISFSLTKVLDALRKDANMELSLKLANEVACSEARSALTAHAWFTA